jgi:spore maturation protein CgeB
VDERDREIAERDARIRELEAALAAQQAREAERLAEQRALHERRLRQVRESITYRVGDEIVRSARSPRRLLRLPLVLRDLYRSRRVIAETAGLDVDALAAPKRSTRAAAVLDEFTLRCFAPELRLVPVPRADWTRALTPAPELLFVESAWEGNGGAWRYALSAWDEQQPNDLAAVVEWCRAHDVPTVFWNKEDPVNFDVFLAAARHFDHVFTTDADTIDRYRDALGHGRVYPLPFAAQPALHNPIGNRRTPPQRVCFAGSWRGDKYERRARDAAVLLRPALDLGVLDIFDRQAGTPGTFPPPYNRAVLGARSYDETVAAYRDYAAFLNLNSVTSSPTMLSRRVFEVLACATPVISTPARAIDELLGDSVIVVETEDDTRKVLERIVADDTYRDHVGQRGYRHVMREHTYSHRVDAMLQSLGLASATHAEPLVTIVCSSMRPARARAVFEALQQQTYPAIEFIFVANADGFDRDLLSELAANTTNTVGTRVLHIDQAQPLGTCLNAALDVARGDYFAKWDDDDVYGPNFLTDLVLAFGYADAAVVGKTTIYAYIESSDTTVLREPGREFTHVNRVAGGSIVADRAQLGAIRFGTMPRGADTQFFRDCREHGLRLFSADRFNHLVYRHATKSAHTWDVSDRDFARESVRVAEGLALDRVLV